MHFIINNTPLNKRRRRRNFWFPAIRAIFNDFWLWFGFTATAKFYRYRFPSLPSVPSVVFDSIDDNEKYLIGHAHSCSLLQQAQQHFTQIALIKDSTSVAISLLVYNCKRPNRLHFIFYSQEEQHPYNGLKSQHFHSLSLESTSLNCHHNYARTFSFALHSTG